MKTLKSLTKTKSVTIFILFFYLWYRPTSQYERRDTIVLPGPSIPNVTLGENCRDLFRLYLRMSIEENNFSIAQNEVDFWSTAKRKLGQTKHNLEAMPPGSGSGSLRHLYDHAPPLPRKRLSHPHHE